MSVVDMVLSPAVPAPIHRGPPPVQVDHSNASKKQPEVQEIIEKKPELKIPKNKIPTASRNSTTDKKDKPKMVRNYKVFCLIFFWHHPLNYYSRKIFDLDRTPDASTVTPTRPRCGGEPLMPRARPSATRAASTRSCMAPRGPWT